MFEFIRNMWIDKKVTADDIKVFIAKGFITQAQCDEILAMVQKNG